eukprot:scaffold7142_cov106-Skeletonema_dohrnii-CCMP3373.AAC.3
MGFSPFGIRYTYLTLIPIDTCTVQSRTKYRKLFSCNRKSDYYSKVDNVSGSSGATTGENDEESGSNLNNSNNNDQYSSYQYQAGGDGDR